MYIMDIPDSKTIDITYAGPFLKKRTMICMSNAMAHRNTKVVLMFIIEKDPYT